MKALALLKTLTLLIVGPAAIAGVSLWVYMQGGRYVSTDNAYLKTDIIAISSEISTPLPTMPARITSGETGVPRLRRSSPVSRRSESEMTSDTNVAPTTEKARICAIWNWTRSSLTGI